MGLINYLSYRNIKIILYIYQNKGFKHAYRSLKEVFSIYWYIERHDLEYSKNKISISELNEQVNDYRYKKYGVEYGFSQFDWLKLGIQSLPFNYKNKTILDIGSGEGIALCYFVQIGFKNVIGIEYAKSLVKTSEKNLGILKKKYKQFNWSIINKDAFDFKIPENVEIIWMFNPFFGELLHGVLKNIHQAGRLRTIYVLYANPPKKNIASKYLIKLKEIRPEYPRLFLYKTKTKIMT